MFWNETLKHFNNNFSEWQLLPQQLHVPRSFHVAFFVPDEFVQCSKEFEDQDDPEDDLEEDEEDYQENDDEEENFP